jgi:hypothetical protein
MYYLYVSEKYKIMVILSIPPKELDPFQKQLYQILEFL